MDLMNNTLDNHIGFAYHDAENGHLTKEERVAETVVLTGRLLTEMHLTMFSDSNSDDDSDRPVYDWESLAVYAEYIANFCRLNAGRKPQPVRHRNAPDPD